MLTCKPDSYHPKLPQHQGLSLYFYPFDRLLNQKVFNALKRPELNRIGFVSECMGEKKSPDLGVQNLTIFDPHKSSVSSLDKVVSKCLVPQSAVRVFERWVPIVSLVILVEENESHYEVIKAPHFL